MAARKCYNDLLPLILRASLAMPDPDRLLSTLRRAVTLFRATPGRVGRVVSPVNCDEVFVVGDLHGNLENFRKILRLAELAAHPRRHLVLQEVIHSELRYPDGGDRSHQLLDLVAALKCQYPARVHFLLGNHELSQHTGRRVGKYDQDMNQQFLAGVLVAYGERFDDVLAAYQDLFAAVPLVVRTANRIYLSHSLPPAELLNDFDPAALLRDVSTPEALQPGGTVHSLVWGRDTSAENARAFLAKVDADLLITGHIPCDEGFEVANECQLILDSFDSPAAYCLFPTDRPLTIQELAALVNLL
jgi:hypothetical protein